MIDKKINYLVDCTLRDGGYYNNWDFSEDLINDYLYAMSCCNIDYVEIGYRSFENDGFKGPNAFAYDYFLNNLNIPENINIGIMLNGNEFAGKKNINNLLTKLFPLKGKNTKVKFVRIASNLDEIKSLLDVIVWLKNEGFKVFINLMKISENSLDELKKYLPELKDFQIDALYLADSYGNLDLKKLEEIIKNIRIFWQGQLGIHAHDNLGLALANTLKASSMGVEWLDSTVCGMGRGAGNAKTEELIIEMIINKSKINFAPLITLINKYFLPLKDKYKWGTNPFYYLAGKYSIHPTFIQIMVNDSRYSEVEILRVIDYLKENESKKFSFSILDHAKDYQNSKRSGSWNPRKVFENREVLILGTGPGVEKYKNGLINFIVKNKPIVIAFNSQDSISSEFINYRIGCHQVRLMADVDFHLKRKEPLIAPLSIFSGDLKKRFIDKNILDFGIIVHDGVFEFNDNFCKVPKSLVIAYSLATIASGNASMAFMAGFDGYPAGDKRNEENNQIIELFNQNSNLNLISITPTNYNLKKKSVFGYLNK